MIRSANEIAGTVLKAARGAGLPLGICEDLSECADFCDAATLEQLLSQLHSAPGCADLTALCCGFDSPEPPDPPAGCMAVARALKAARGGGGALGPRDIPDDLWRGLSDLAARILVPATDASRAAGAGAGLDDND